MICPTFAASTGGSFTNLEKTWKPGAQTLIFFALKPFSTIASCKAVKITFSRVASCEPSAPRGLITKLVSSSPPASLISNSASFRLPAPKSTVKNDLVFSIEWLHQSHHPTGFANRVMATRINYGKSSHGSNRKQKKIRPRKKNCGGISKFNPSLILHRLDSSGHAQCKTPAGRFFP